MACLFLQFYALARVLKNHIYTYFLFMKPRLRAFGHVIFFTNAVYQ